MAVRILYKDLIPQGKEDISSQTYTQPNENITDLSLLLQDGNASQNIATLEYNQWRLDGTFKGLRESVPYWSECVSSDTATNGVYMFDTPIVITRIFAHKHQTLGITFTFGSDTDYCNSLNIKWYEDDTLVEQGDYTPDNYEYFCEKPVERFNKIVITMYGMNKQNRYLKIYSVDDGTYRTFTNEDLYRVNILEDMTLTSEQLPINTLTVSLESGEDTEYIFQRKQPVDAFLDDEFLGTFFITEGTRDSKTIYNFKAQDYKGVLEDTKFYGGMYKVVHAGVIIDEILQDEKFTYTIDTATYYTPLTGYIPICTKREALAQVLFACCSVCDTSRKRKLDIYKINNADTPLDIDHEKIYMGGKVATTDVVTSVKVAAHEYTIKAEREQLFEGTIGIGDTYIEFANPVVAESISMTLLENVRITKRNSNYIIISNTTELEKEVTVTAYPYEENVTYKIKENEGVVANIAAKEIEATSATLVSTTNIDAVLDNLYEYYVKNTKYEGEIQIDEDVFVGKLVTLHTEWQGDKTGRIEQLDYDVRNRKIGKVVQRIHG